MEMGGGGGANRAHRQPQVCQLNYCHKLSFCFPSLAIKSINDYTISSLNSTQLF